MVNSGHFRFDSRAGSAGAVTSANVIQVAAPSIGGIVPIIFFGINIANQGVAGMTNAYGLMLLLKPELPTITLEYSLVVMLESDRQLLLKN